jgi:hypothetical protein
MKCGGANLIRIDRGEVRLVWTARIPAAKPLKMREWDPDNLTKIMQVMKRPCEHKCSEIKFSFQFLKLSFLFEVFVLFFF